MGSNFKYLIFILELIINLTNGDVILIQNSKQPTSSSTAPEQNFTTNIEINGTEFSTPSTTSNNNSINSDNINLNETIIKKTTKPIISATTTPLPAITTSNLMLNNNTDNVETSTDTTINTTKLTPSILSSTSAIESQTQSKTTTTIEIPITTTNNSTSTTADSGSDTTIVVIKSKSTSTTVAEDLLIPPSNVTPNIGHKDAINDDKQITVIKTADCPSLENADSLSQTQLIERLTHGCRYDRLERPITYLGTGENKTRLPVNVFARAYIYFMQSLEAHDLQFKIHALLQMRFVDPRLAFSDIAPSRNQPILGEASLRQALWIPHIFFANERDSSILGTDQKDVLTSISGDGTVILSIRIQATLYCWMNLRKFPFDEQHCATNLESWMYNTSELVLHWEKKSPITLAPELHLTEYVLMNMYHNETTIIADLSDLRHGAFAGNYSSLSFTVHLAREMGFYLMDYFLPSMMIVAISWVSFWLQADQSAPRITLGTSTMLTFITLASAQGKTLPKVSYIKVSEVWFLGCTGFIFGTLVEFAFVNTIWRRHKNVELKKVNSKYILKSTLTPRAARKELGLQKSQSCTSLDRQGSVKSGKSGSTTAAYNNYLTVHSFQNMPTVPSKNNLPIIRTESADDFLDNGHISINMEPLNRSNQNMISNSTLDGNGNNNNISWTTMTPQQIAIWIDKRARFVFPISFIVFNALFWTFVYVL
ncbi:pH-sensitive chloride channel 2-like [Condylostylus longicornis]|uniref:pH-sensitive chloride channel 2-like n=1 Tax=Condylostylus longicornis TaxID=2530218 RepID=UPI00244E1D65|nr:pH-sensitive chloride channel 2-like [Condylostylus longicornis]XP_055375612.1 pH-sensitive chloride channel 2-like [Condylostylus longicornis]